MNRAYGLREVRPWWLTRLESIGYVVCGAFAMLAFALWWCSGPDLAPRHQRGPGLEPLSLTVAIGRIGITAFLLLTVLVIAHKFVATGAPLGSGGGARHRSDAPAVVPGRPRLRLLPRPVLQRLRLDLGGLATAMVFLVFLYWLAAMFLFGGEINGTVIAARRVRLQARMQEKQAEPWALSLHCFICAQGAR